MLTHLNSTPVLKHQINKRSFTIVCSTLYRNVNSKILNMNLYYLSKTDKQKKYALIFLTADITNKIQP